MKHKLIYHTNVPVAELIGEQPVSVTTDDRHHTTKLESVARDGLTLKCDRATLDFLLPNHGSLSPRQPKTIHTHFALNMDVDKSQIEVDTDCEVFCVRRLSRDEYQLQLRFKSLNKRDAKSVDRYVEQHLKEQSVAA